MEHTTNTITVRGTLLQLPQLSHENHGRRFFRFTLEIPRLSGTVDLLPVVAPEPLVQQLDPCAGSMLTVTGQIRSHNHHSEGTRHLMIFIFASQLTVEDGDPINEVIVEGPLCREPVFRRTPLGREICDVMLAVSRSYGRADYLPCILWGNHARLAASYPVGTALLLTGRLQSREYIKLTEGGSESRTTYEISVITAEVQGEEV